MITQVAIAGASIERWALAQVAKNQRLKLSSSVPADLRESAKKRQYEVAVVEAFLRLGAQSFAAHGSEALWERQFRTGQRGRPKSVDVALFNEKRMEEAWIEFGEFSSSKLRTDAAKLLALKPAQGYSAARFLILYDEHPKRVTGALAQEWVEATASAAESASTVEMKVQLRVTAVMDSAIVESASSEGSVRTAVFSIGDAVPVPIVATDEHDGG
ncbi:hypothetical protein C8046_11730 [Serinibacter arcticus]|uniref:Uncharacterized protein n=2 Tax=Serinibacter arcticus TaxID=1655435 RepID=A0A2U1ZWC5_9MICO|nr:hypothetical protein C8046_11730 [Serinibacter arcticus]